MTTYTVRIGKGGQTEEFEASSSARALVLARKKYPQECYFWVVNTQQEKVPFEIDASYKQKHSFTTKGGINEIRHPRFKKG